MDNLMIRRYGNLRMGPGRKLMCGAIRNNWYCRRIGEDGKSARHRKQTGKQNGNTLQFLPSPLKSFLKSATDLRERAFRNRRSGAPSSPNRARIAFSMYDW